MNFRFLLLSPLLVTASSGPEIKNITANPGLLASSLGPARLVNGYHSLTHYYRISELIEKTESLKKTYLRSLDELKTDRTGFEYTELLRNTINTTIELIENKLSDTHLSPPKNVKINLRKRRGLINGLGSIIKFISGNLDSTDEEKYDKIIRQLQNSQQDMQVQVSAQYSINEAIMKNFNKTIETMAHNNEEIRKELEFWKTQNPHYSHMAEVRSIYEHLQTALSLLLEVVQDIENSVVACRSGILHPSVVSPHLLYQELSKLSKHYRNKIPDFENQNLFEILSYFRVRCYIGVEEIIYFIDVPIMDPVLYTQIHLEPLPTEIDGEFMTIIPETKNFLKSDQQIIPLIQKCPRIGHTHLCPNYLISQSDPKCESHFLTSSVTSKCQFIKINVENNHVKLMLDINRYLLFFPKGDTISIIQDKETETRTLFGIYLASPGEQHLIYKNQTLFTPKNEMAGKPFIIGDVSLELTKDQMPIKEINLRELELDSLNLLNYKIHDNNDVINFVRPSLWTIILYVVIISLVLYTTYRYCKTMRTLPISSQT